MNIGKVGAFRVMVRVTFIYIFTALVIGNYILAFRRTRYCDFSVNLLTIFILFIISYLVQINYVLFAPQPFTYDIIEV